MSPQKPILFSYFRSSCSWRVRIALALKNIDYEYKAVNLLKKENLGEEYSKFNPMGHVPALVYEGNTLTQSMSILEFLEEKFPEVSLLPKCHVLRSKVREICELIGSGIQPLQNLSVLKRIGDEKKMEWAHYYIDFGFSALEKLLCESSGQYAVGDTLTLADCFIVPQVYNAGRFNVDMSKFPTISTINQNLMKLEAFKVAHPSNQPDCPQDLK